MIRRFMYNNNMIKRNGDEYVKISTGIFESYGITEKQKDCFLG